MKTARCGVFVLLLSSLAALQAAAQCNRNPVAGDITIPVYPAQAIEINLVSQSSDPEGLPLRVAAVTAPTTGSNSSEQDGTVIFTPAQSATGATFSFTIQNTAGGSDSASVFIGTDAPPGGPVEPPANEGPVLYDVTCAPFDQNSGTADCDFLAHPSALQAPNIRTWSWDFGDATQSGQAGEAHHTYHQINHEQSTLLTVSYYSGQVYTFGKLVDVGKTVVAFDAYWSYNSPSNPAGLVIGFHPRNPNQQYDDNGVVRDIIYAWDTARDDPAAIWSCQPLGCIQPRTTYSHPGTFTVALERRKLDGTVVAFYETDITVTNAPPVARFTVGSSPCTNCTFDATPTSQPETGTTDEWGLDRQRGIVRLEWDFGDGTYETVEPVGSAPVRLTAAHTYMTGGTKVVKLRAIDAFGASSVLFERNLSVPNNPPKADFEFDCDGLACLFDPTPSSDDNGITSYSWSINGATTATTASADEFVPQWSPGTYTVSLTVTDAQEATGTFSRVVTVSDAAAAPYRFFAVTPCRLLDSRVSGGPLLSGQGRTIQVAGVCGVPTTARAIQVATTIVSPTADGLLRLGSSVNTAMVYTASRQPVTANTIALLTGDSLIATPTINGSAGQTHLIVDVTGYFADDALASYPLYAKGPYGFQAIPPCRIIDSHQSGGALLPEQVRDIRVTGTPPCGIKDDAAAAALNLTMTAPTGAGHASLYPSNIAVAPLNATLSVLAGLSGSNGAIVGLGKRALDDLTLGYTSTGGASSHFLLDASGWFSPNAPLRYFPLPSGCRAADTRDPSRGDPRLSGAPYDFQIQGNCGVPRGAVAAAVTLSVLSPDSNGTLTVSGSGQSAPYAAIPFVAGDKLSNGLIVPLSINRRDLSVTTAPATSVDLQIDVAGYFAPDPACEGQGPVISAHPGSLMILQGTSTTLSVNASGGSLSYQWYQGTAPSTSTPLGTNNSSLTVSPSSTTSYWVRVTNECGSRDSGTAVVTPTNCLPPTISRQPQPQLIGIGATATLSVIASGLPGPLRYEWYRGDTGDTSQRVGTDSASFTTPALTATTWYWVRVISACGGGTIDSETAAVTVTSCVPVSITTHPLSQTVSYGSTATLRVIVAGTEPINYQWYHGTAGINPEVGTNSNTLTVPKVTEEGSYWVTVTSGCSASWVHSETAVVSVCPVSAPEIRDQTSSLGILSGGSATLTVEATSDTVSKTVAMLHYQWFEGLGAASIPVGTDSNNLTVSPANTTVYWVRVSNECPTVTDSVPITVTICDPPAITSQPASQSISSGTAATLHVTATGPDLSYQWYQGAGEGTPAPGASTGSSYTTPALAATTVYWVKVTSQCSGATVSSAPATVSVCVAPAIATQPLSQTIATGASATLSVNATGSSLRYEWYQNPSGVVGPIVGTASTYTTPPLQSTTPYWVKVISDCNGASVPSATATIKVCAPLGIDVQPASQVVNPGSTATLNVIPRGSGPYLHEWFEGPSGTTTNRVGTDSTFTTPPIAADTTRLYWVRVTSTCNGSTINSNAATISTVPQIVRRQVASSVAIGATTVTATWPSPTQQGSLLVAVLSTTHSARITAPVMPGWTEAASYWSGDDQMRTGIYYIANAPAGRTSEHAETTFWNHFYDHVLQIAEYRGVLSAPLDRVSFAGASTPDAGFVTSGTTAPTGNLNELIITALSSYAPTSFTAVTPGFTRIHQNDTGPTHNLTTAVHERIVNTAGTQQLTATVGANAPWVGLIATFAGYNPACGTPAPVITTQPVSRTINSGSTATFNVAAINGTPSYQWFEGVPPNHHPVDVGANSASYTTPALTASASYWVRVSNGCGQVDSNIVTANVCQLPTITSQPVSSQTIAPGGTATLSVTAGGSGPFDYQWFKGTTNTDESTPVGSNSSTYATPALNANTSYWVKVTSRCNTPNTSVRSNVANIIVTACPPLTMVPSPSSQGIVSGSTATIVTTNDPRLTYLWLQGFDWHTATPAPGANTSPTYTTPALTASTVYWVKISDSCGNSVVAGPAGVNVCPAYSIATQPVSQYTSGTAAIHAIVANGNNLTWKWYQGQQGDESTPAAGQTNYWGGGDYSYTNVDNGVTASYWAKFTDSCGIVVRSNAATIEICQPVSINTQPASQTIPAGMTATLGVAATGTNLVYHWYQGARPDMTTTAPGVSNGSTYTTPALTSSTSYWVSVLNVCGSGLYSNTATVTVSGCQALSISSQPASQTINSGSTATLSVSVTGSGPLTYQWFQGSTPVGTNSSTFTTPVLTATTSYSVRVTSSCNGSVVTSAPATITVNSCQPPAITAQPASQTINAGATATLTIAATGAGPLSYQWFQGASGVATAPVGSNSNTFTTPALGASAQYWVRVTGCGGAINSATATVTVQTALAQLAASNTAAPRTSQATSWNQPTQAKSLLVAVVSGSSTAPVSPFTMTTGWQLASSHTSGNVRTSIYFYPNCPAGRTSETVTSSAPSDLILQIAEYRGVANAAPLDKVAIDGNAAPVSTTVSSGLTPQTSQAKELVLTAITAATATSFSSPTNSFTEISDRTVGQLTTALHQRVVAATGAYGHNATAGALPPRWIGQVVTFKAADTSASQILEPEAQQAAETGGTQ